MNLHFIYLCRVGDLKEAKKFLQFYQNINISAKNEYAFRVACEYRCVEVAKWLLSLKPDINISAQDDEAFRGACYYEYLEVAKWLQTLKPYLYVIEYDENGNYSGYKIRSKEEIIWERRKHALHLALQVENNLLYHLPVDIAKTVTLFV